MKPRFLFFLFIVLTALVRGEPLIRIRTSLGIIEVELDSKHAPKTVANFLKHVDAGHYAGGQFHRTVTSRPDNQPNNAVKIDVIQGGANPTLTDQNWPPVSLERTSVTGLKHEDGTLSMARAEADTATSDFFICIGAQPGLDFGGKRNPDGQGFAAFGRVIKGMEIIRVIHASKAEGQTLAPSVRIERIERTLEGH